MGIFLFAALITPVFRILRHAYRRACARRIAGALLPLTEESLTFDQLGTVLSSSKALEQLRSLIGTGYLQNLQINAVTRTVALYTPEGTFVQWICPGCGAKNSGKFCSECGRPRPAAKCANCGFVPADPANPPKFCPECGKPFGA